MKKIICIFSVLYAAIGVSAQEMTQEQWEEKVIYVGTRLAGSYLLNCKDQNDKQLGRSILLMKDSSFNQISTYLQENGGQTTNSYFTDYYNNKINTSDKSIGVLLDFSFFAPSVPEKVSQVLEPLLIDQGWYYDENQPDVSSGCEDDFLNKNEELSRKLDSGGKPIISAEILNYMIVVLLLLLIIEIPLIVSVCRLRKKVKNSLSQDVILRLKEKILKEIDLSEYATKRNINELDRQMNKLSEDINTCVKKYDLNGYATKGFMSNLDNKQKEQEDRIKNIEEIINNIKPADKNGDEKKYNFQSSASVASGSVQSESKPNNPSDEQHSQTMIVKHTGNGRLKECSKGDPDAFFELKIYDGKEEAELSYCGTIEQAKADPDGIFSPVVAKYKGDSSAATQILTKSKGKAYKSNGVWVVREPVTVEFE